MIAHTITVLFQGIEVGVLSQPEGEIFASFQYYPEWIAGGFSISPIHMPLSNKVYQFRHLPDETFKGLPSVFADSLPDDFGNAVIDQWLARNGKDKTQFGALDRLLYIGNRGMGGLEYQPATDVHSGEPEDLNIAELVSLAQSVLNDRESVSVETEPDAGIYQLFQIGTSAGGARAKAVIAMNDDLNHAISGQIEVPNGYTHYLIKFDGVSAKSKSEQSFGDPTGYGSMEFAYHRMARDCGIDMSDCQLFEEGGRKHFVTKRFDREENQKYHTLSLCGMDHADFRKVGQYSYEQFLSVARQLGLNHAEQVEIFRRMVFNVVARNQDDHTKNFAFFVNDDFEWSLAPAYDLAFSYKPGSIWVTQHAMSINGKRDDFTRSDLLAVADLITGLRTKAANKIIDDVTSVVKNWEKYSKESDVPENLSSEIKANVRTNLV